MVFISTAMYPEAQPFIKELNLKKDITSHKFQIFKNEEVILIITGVGKMKAAIAVTYLFSSYEPQNTDMFFNIGICGASNQKIEVGKAFICNKIIENDTKKTYYPDILFKHPFNEASIETCSRVINNEMIELEGKLVDMEASGVYQAASVFLQPHQIIIIKIVSDYLNTKGLRKDRVVKLIEYTAVQITCLIDEIKYGYSHDQSVFTYEEHNIIRDIMENLKLSTTMKNQLKQLLTYYKLQNINFIDIISSYADIKCKSKKDGKRYFAEIKQKII